MAHQDTTDRMDEQGLIAGIALAVLLAFSLIAVGSIVLRAF